jgi:hypothetical protein
MPSAFSNYYVNPLAAGAPAISQLPDFHLPIFGNLQSSYSPSNSSYPPNPSYPNTGGRRMPSYAVAPTFEYRTAGPNQLQTEVEQVLTRSTSLSPNREIRVEVQGPVVVLRGTVANEHDRRLAEGLVRLTPGVQDVRNELKMSGTTPPLARPAP